MAKLTRKENKIFAGSASNNGQFGSAQVGTKVTSTDLDTLQALSAYLTGWSDAALGGERLPPLEEMQALFYIATRQLSYLFQEGIPEYDASTEYYQKSIVKKAGTYEIYGSLTNNNLGNALTDTGNWELLQDLSSAVTDATESVKGISYIATQSEVNAGTNDTKFVTPLKLKTSSGLDSYSTRSISTSYEAETSGFFYGYFEATSSDTTVSVLMGTSSPTVTVFKLSLGTDVADRRFGSFCLPVSDGEFYRAIVSSGTATGTLKWKPFNI